jgi:hypothetical protein
MVNGNDIVEHIERCNECMQRQLKIEETKDEETKKKLNKEIESCFDNSFREE